MADQNGVADASGIPLPGDRLPLVVAPAPAVERLLVNELGRIEAVLSADGGLYFATGSGGTDDRGRPADAVEWSLARIRSGFRSTRAAYSRGHG